MWVSVFVNVTLWNMDTTEEVQYSEEEVQFRGSAVQRKCSTWGGWRGRDGTMGKGTEYWVSMYILQVYYKPDQDT